MAHYTILFMPVFASRRAKKILINKKKEKLYIKKKRKEKREERVRTKQE